jgi:hypothetical protein
LYLRGYHTLWRAISGYFDLAKLTFGPAYNTTSPLRDSV